MEDNEIKIDLGNDAINIHISSLASYKLNAYIFYNLLKDCKKEHGSIDAIDIIEKIETPDFIEFHFKCKLILNIHTKQGSSNTIHFNNHVYFSYMVDSSSIAKNDLPKLKREYNYEEKNYRSIFEKEVCINFNCSRRLIFSHCEFKSKLSLSESKYNNASNGYPNGIDFEHCIFGDEIEFKSFILGTPLSVNQHYDNIQETNFKNCIFKKRVDFSNSKFYNNIYFNNSIFKDSADFHECDFRKTACFYGVKFDKAFNFSQIQFKENLNVVNANLNFGFESLKEKIKQEHIEYNKRESIKKPLAHFANDFRDSFRIFKSTLIKDNNLLDASNFHKYELYSKEIELDSKETKTLKEKVEKLQLWFYRNLCDHHTDILKSFHSLMLVIGLFGLMGFGVIAGFDYCLGYKPILSHLYMIKEIYDAHIQSFIKTHTLYTFACDFLISGAYLLMLFISINWKIPRVFLIGVSYAIVICILLVSPKILIPAMGIFTDKRELLDPLSTLGGIYTIIFGFVLFSFIKTIRKNSIVPN